MAVGSQKKPARKLVDASNKSTRGRMSRNKTPFQNGGDSWKESLMVINTNISALSGARLLGESSAMLAKSLARLSSGSKLVAPEDDAAGAAVSLRFDAQINRVQATKPTLAMPSHSARLRMGS